MKRTLQTIKPNQTQREAAALLEILALGNQEIEQGKTKPAADVIDSLRKKAPSAEHDS